MRRDVDAWVLGMLGAPFSVVFASVLAHLVYSGPVGVLNVLLWQGIVGMWVFMASIVVCPLPFFVAERLGIPAQPRARLWWAVAALAVAFGTIFLIGQSRASLGILTFAGLLGIMLNVALFGAVYARSNSSSSGRATSARRST
jgi:hypothetical protein